MAFPKVTVVLAMAIAGSACASPRLWATGLIRLARSARPCSREGIPTIRSSALSSIRAAVAKLWSTTMVCCSLKGNPGESCGGSERLILSDHRMPPHVLAARGPC